MTLIQWSEQFVTGFDLIDAQHRKLVDLINGAAPRLLDPEGTSKDELNTLLNQLADYAAYHFSSEEALMLDSGVAADHVTRHQRTHAQFTQEIARLIRDSVAAQTFSGSGLLRFLSSWLIFHILSDDQRLAAQIRAIREGATAQQALAAATASPVPASAVLSQSLIDLFAVVSERNRALSASNEQLEQARSALAEANAELETRVAQRTAELQQSKEWLEHERQALSASLEQLKSAQAQLLQAEKMAAIGQLAAGVAHEINNPVGFVNSNLSSLNDYATRLLRLADSARPLADAVHEAHPARQEFVRLCAETDLDFIRQDLPDLIRESGDGLERVSRIVSDLREFSCIDGSEWQAVDLNRALESTLNLLAPEFGPRIEIVKQFGPLPRLSCVAAQINQVFMSLLRNAFQAIPDTGTITLRTRDEQSKIRVEVTDTGCGMSEATQKRAFEPFFTTRPVGKGTGLGLSSAWEIVKKHGGSIAVDSVPGKGSTFTVLLPTLDQTKHTEQGIRT